MALGASGGFAADGFPRVPPTPPEKAEATFEVQHGFRMELIAAEPLVADPVDMAYDEDGRAYVVSEDALVIALDGPISARAFRRRMNRNPPMMPASATPPAAR